MSGMMGGIKAIRGNTDPDPSWTLRGDIQQGQPVYVEMIPNLKQRIKKGPKGEDLWRLNPQTGQPIKPITELYQDTKEPVIRREFVLVDLGNGIVQKNYLFAASPEDIVRRGDSLSPAELTARLKAQEEQIQQLVGLLGEKVQEALPELERRVNEDEDTLETLDVPTLESELATDGELAQAGGSSDAVATVVQARSRRKR